MRLSAFALLFVTACSAPADQAIVESVQSPDARRRFSDTVATMLLDTTVHELRAQLFVKIQNPNKDDESPLADSAVLSLAGPGAHTMDGKVYAELAVMQALLGESVKVRIDTARGHVFVGEPAVLLIGHMHGNDLYVPVKLFARQFGAYTDIGCTLANCATIWRRDVIELMIRNGNTGGAGILEGHAEGIVRGVDVSKLPTG